MSRRIAGSRWPASQTYMATTSRNAKSLSFDLCQSCVGTVDSALPLDVRKVYDLPFGQINEGGCAHDLGEAPISLAFVGRPEAFRTSGGKAAYALRLPSNTFMRS